MENLAEARIELSAVQANLQFIQQKVGPGVEVMVMVKADAYGHGAVELSRAYEKWGVGEFGVAHISEAVALRRAGIQGNIVVFQPGFQLDPEPYQTFHLEAVLNSIEDIDFFSAKWRIPCHLMVDTGMGREGVLPSEIPVFLEKLKTRHGIQLKGLCTHFAQADEVNLAPAQKQLRLFNSVIKVLPSDLRENLVIHAANSGAIINCPDAYFNRVRPGILLYGLYSGAGIVQQKPAMSIHARLINRKWVPEGYKVGYGGTFTTARRTLLGLFCIGYADGFLRSHSNTSQVWLNGKAYPVVGRVSMDLLVVDLCGNEELGLGTEFVIRRGEVGDGSSLFQDAEKTGTITYERSCQLGSMRLPRVYI